MAQKKASYGNESISALKGADRVRKRPGVIFGSDGLEGCEHAVFEIMSNAIDEAREGHGSLITVTRFLDKSSAFQSTPLRRVGIQYLSWLIRLFTGTKVTDPTSGFRAANQAVIRDLADYYPADYPEPESIVQIKKMRHRIQEVQVNMFQREGGQSSIRSWKSIYYMIKVSVAVVCASLQKGRKKK